jgi:hypothetical protein
VKSPNTEWIMPGETGYQIIIDTRPKADGLGLQANINIRDLK